MRSRHHSAEELRISREEVDAWMAAAGFSPAQKIKLFSDKLFVIYARK